MFDQLNLYEYHSDPTKLVGYDNLQETTRAAFARAYKYLATKGRPLNWTVTKNEDNIELSNGKYVFLCQVSVRPDTLQAQYLIIDTAVDDYLWHTSLTDAWSEVLELADIEPYS
jgi:hypothetical protein